MAISLPRIEAVMHGRSSDDSGDRPPLRVFGHAGGRLTPLALDNAQRKLDATLFSVTTGGLTRKQIDEAELVTSVVMARFRAALRVFAAW